MIINNRPYTPHPRSNYIDDALITDKSKIEQAFISEWIKNNLTYSPRKLSSTSYGLKAKVEDYLKDLQNRYGSDLIRDTYISNNQFKDAMLLEGYEPIDPDALNWEYRARFKRWN